MKKIRQIFNAGQSLFEVLFAVGIAAIILVAVVSLSTQSIKTSDASRNNSLASKFTQEGIEWVRQQRDASWTNLTSQLADTDINLGGETWDSVNPVTVNGVPTIFSRTVRLTPVPAVNPTTFIVEVKVTWMDSGGTHEVKDSTKLTNWRQ